MSRSNTPNNGDFNFEDDEFEIIDANEMQFVKRGRKAMADEKLIEMIATLPKGKALAIKKMKLDPNAADYKNEKARISSQIRTAIRAANRETMPIKWSPEGVPQIQG